MTPDEHTIKEQYVEVGDGHELYVYEWGNPNGLPIIHLHGGPGSNANDGHKSTYDPLTQHVIFFDQRGCGKSLPYGSLEHNTTQDMVEDIEKIAHKLKLTTFVITGGSWGSCLALAYALKYPGRVRAMVLRGIFTGSQAEIDYLDKGRFATHFPDAWDRYMDATPAKYHDDPGRYHAKRILGSDADAAKESAFAYHNLEGAILRLDDRFALGGKDDFDPTGTKLEVYYMTNRCFMPDRYIMNNARKLTMPIWLIQGRYDFVCPPVTAYELNEKLPNSRLIWTTAGHGNDRANYDINRALLLQLSVGQ